MIAINTCILFLSIENICDFIIIIINYAHTHTHNDALLSGQTVNELSNNLLDSLDIGSSNGSNNSKVSSILYCLSSSKKIINIFFIL